MKQLGRLHRIAKAFFVPNFAAPHQARSKPDWLEPDPNQATANVVLKKRCQMDSQIVSSRTLRGKLFCRYGLLQIVKLKQKNNALHDAAWMI
jgi:hypothetical protein